MTIHEDVTAYLQTVTALTALVGTRIMTPDLKQGTALPAVAFWRVTETPLHVRSIMRPRFQCDCWADDPLECEQVADALTSALDGFHGQMGSRHVVSLVVNTMGPRQDPVTGFYRSTIDTRLIYGRPVS